jgi:tetratricopeptide (TPR) repeat protein
MFFPKLRRRAKWVFLALAIAFAGGFLIFGVGAGGSGIGDYISQLLNRDSVSGPSVEDAEKKIEDNPNDAAAHLELAQALQAQGRTDGAIGEYERYTGMKPKDADALRALAALYGQKVVDAQQRASAANAAAQEANLEQTLAPSSPFAQELAKDKVSESVAAEANAKAQAAQAEVQRAARLQTSVYERLTLLVRDDPLLYLQFAQAAETGQEYDSAIAAYRQFLQLSPDDPSAKQVRDRIKLLQSLGSGTSG